MGKLSAPAPDSSEIHKALRLLFRQGDVAEIRVPKAGRYGTISGYFDNSVALVHSALSVDGKGTGSYVTLNPVDRALLARSANKLKDHALLATSDSDIVRRRWLPIDLDPNRPAGISSTDEQHQAALRRAQTTANELADDGWPEPVIADSGNGAHLLYRVDLPNDQQSTDLIARLLTAISNRYGDKDIAVDRTVYNAARIIKLYGTVARKGDNTPERPHRLSRILAIPEHLEILSLDLVNKLASETAEPIRTTPKKNGAGHRAGFELEDWMQRPGLEIDRGPIAWGDRGEKWVLKACPFDSNHTGGCAVITRGYDGKLGFKCQHNSCSGKGWRALRDLLEPTRKAPTGSANQSLPEQATVAEWPEPIPFQERVVTPLPIDLLPGFLGEMVAATARATETPVELAALIGLSVIATSLAGKVRVSPEAGYSEPVNIYTAAAMESGNRKTAVLTMMTAPLVDWEQTENQRTAPERKRVLSERKSLEARVEILRKQAAKGSKSGTAL